MAPELTTNEYLKDVENKPILMGEHKLESSKSEKYLLDMISRDGKSPSITKTLDKHEAGLKDTLDDFRE